MKYLLIPIVLLITSLSCSNQETENKHIGADSLSVTTSQPADSAEITDTEYELNYVVAVAEGYDYAELRKIAQEACDFLNFKLDTMDRYYNPKKKKIVLPDNHEDEIWAGDYYLRRTGDTFVSIEMRNAYVDTLTNKNEQAKAAFEADSLKMFVFATMYNNKKQADSLFQVLKPKFKQTTLIPTEIFMGCMH